MLTIWCSHLALLLDLAAVEVAAAHGVDEELAHGRAHGAQLVEHVQVRLQVVEGGGGGGGEAAGIGRVDAAQVLEQGEEEVGEQEVAAARQRGGRE